VPQGISFSWEIQLETNLEIPIVSSDTVALCFCSPGICRARRSKKHSQCGSAAI